MGLFSKPEDEQVTVPSNWISSHLTLNAKDFECLVRGGILHVGTLSIALSDIGFDKMYQSIEKAQDGIELYKSHIKR